MSGPVEVVGAAVDAINRQDWAAAAALCDPASLSLFKRHLLQRVDPPREMNQTTVEQLMRTQPDMPREAAEYHVAMSRKYSDAQAILWNEVPGVTSVEELQGMMPEEIFAAHLSANTLEHQLAVARRHGHIPPEAEAHAGTVKVPTANYVLLGSVEDGRHIAHVVYRRELAHANRSGGGPGDAFAELTQEERQFSLDTQRGRPEVSTCRRQPDGTWRLIAAHDFLGQSSWAFAYVDEVQE